MANITSGKKKHVLPAIVSFFIPGLGQVVKGHVAKGAGIFVVLLVIGLLGKIPFIGWIAGIVGLIGWVVNILDALVSEDDEKLIQ